jgi:hypothetical protein
VAAGHAGWARRAVRDEEVITRLARKELPESFARVCCGWAGQLPAGLRAWGQQTLLNAARDGADLRDLNALGRQMAEEARAGAPPDEDQLAPGDRAVRLETTIGGAGVLSGDLTPGCAAALASVLESLACPGRAGDTRSQRQRYHDALEEAARRLIAAGLLPQRTGQPARVWAHISLADLLALDPGAAVTQEWIDRARTRARSAAARAAASVAGGDGAAWLDGQSAAGFACDAAITPVVTGDVDPGALQDLVRLCAELAGYGPRGRADGADEAGPPPPTGRGRDALEQAIIGKTMFFLLHSRSCSELHRCCFSLLMVTARQRRVDLRPSVTACTSPRAAALTFVLLLGILLLSIPDNGAHFVPAGEASVMIAPGRVAKLQG